ncbi:centrosomal protein of 55 kDa [Aplochiton taeniatus]
MTSKGTKETIVTKLGFKSSSNSKVDAELDRVRKENTHLRRKVDELSKRHAKPPDSDKSKLLERILSLETLRERNNQQLLVREQELQTMRQQLSAKGGEVVSSLQAQLELRRKELEQRDRLFQNLSDETHNLKNKLAAVTARCQTLDTQGAQVPSSDLVVLQEQLKDALEKNQQWLLYDQQREAYVQSVLGRTMELEQQLQAKQQQQQQPNKEASAESEREKAPAPEKSPAQLQDYYDGLLLGAKRDLEAQREKTSQAQMELQTHKDQLSRTQAELSAQRELAARTRAEVSTLQRRSEEKSRELEDTKEQLQKERFNSRHTVSEERKCSSERTDRFRLELENMDARLEEERKRSAELLLQVTLLQKSLLSQSEDQRRIAVLEQQIQLSSKDFDDEKVDRQSMQHQLQKVLRELRKARDQITRLESAKHTRESRFSEPSSYSKLEFDRLTIPDPGSTSPSKGTNFLDESFLECPKCRAPYATSQHRELLAHIDYCFE